MHTIETEIQFSPTCYDSILIFADIRENSISTKCRSFMVVPPFSQGFPRFSSIFPRFSRISPSFSSISLGVPPFAPCFSTIFPAAEHPPKALPYGPLREQTINDLVIGASPCRNSADDGMISLVTPLQNNMLPETPKKKLF